MASLFFSKGHGKWKCKWRSRGGNRVPVWVTVTLCEHPGWAKGKPVPKKPPADAVRLFHKYEGMELAADHGVAVTTLRAASLADFLAAYVQSAEVNVVAGSLVIKKREVERFGQWCEERKIEHVPQVTAEVCRTYLEDLSRTLGRGTVRTIKGTLAPAWSQAFQEGKVTANPWARAKVPGKPREERPPYWTEAEVDRLVAKCPRWLADVVNVGFGSGLRISALLSLTWADVDFAKGVLHVRAAESKSGKPYDAPMLDRSRDTLQRLAVEREERGLVFRHPDRSPLTGGRTYDAIETRARRAGIPLLGHFNHILRHSFATLAVNRGVPLKVVSRWLGHASITMTEKYAHADPRESRQWAEFLSGTGERTEPAAESVESLRTEVERLRSLLGQAVAESRAG